MKVSPIYFHIMEDTLVKVERDPDNVVKVCFGHYDCSTSIFFWPGTEQVLWKLRDALNEILEGVPVPEAQAPDERPPWEE